MAKNPYKTYKFKVRTKLRALIQYICTTKSYIAIFGYYYKRDADKINILLTSKCQRNCVDCSQMCMQAPSKDKMSVDQVKKSLQEFIDTNKKWKVLRVTGGEATLDDDLLEVFKEIKKYLAFSPKTEVHLLTNGYGEEVKKRLTKIPSWVKIISTDKETDQFDHFTRINAAPIDMSGYKNRDFRAGCFALRGCSLTITKNGYYPCATAHGIDRVMNLNMGRRRLPDDKDSMREILGKTCRYCGFYLYNDPKKQPGYYSPVWEKALKKYKEKKPELNEY